MSMIGHFVKITPAFLQEVIDDPDRATQLVYPEDDSYPEPPAALDIDKAWHLIHFLLVGEAWGGDGPLATAVLGGEALEGTDAGYGPFRYLHPEQVQNVAKALGHVDSEDLWKNFDAKKVAEAKVYPAGWESGEDDKQYICQNFESLKAFYAEAAAAGSALLLYIA